MCQSASAAPRSAHCTPLRRMAPFVSLLPSATRAFASDMSHAHLLHQARVPAAQRQTAPLHPCAKPPAGPPPIRKGILSPTQPVHRPDLHSPALPAPCAGCVWCIRSGHISPLQPCGAPRGESLSFPQPQTRHARNTHTFTLPVRQWTRVPSPMLKVPACVTGTHHIPTAMRQGIGACLHTKNL